MYVRIYMYIYVWSFMVIYDDRDDRFMNLFNYSSWIELTKAWWNLLDRIGQKILTWFRAKEDPTETQ